MYNQPFQNSYQSSFGGTSLQGQRSQQSFQPTGYVPSSYGQNQQQYGAAPSPESYHTANYRGNLQGHDQGLRSDSFYPAQQQGGRGLETNYSSFRYGVRGNEQQSYGGNFGGLGTSSYAGGQAFGGASYGQQFQAQGGYGQQQVSPESYHLANYRGNQQGHDQGLRGDSFYPAQQQGGQSIEANSGSFRYGVRGNEQSFNNVNNVSSQFGYSSTPIGGQSFGGASYGQQFQAQGGYSQQQVSPESYHLANYRGNQQGHDQGLRGDSFYPAQQQGGQGFESSSSSFRYGVRGNEQSFNNVNNVSSQFGFSASPVSSFSSYSTF